MMFSLMRNVGYSMVINKIRRRTVMSLIRSHKMSSFMPLTQLSEDEIMFKETAARYAVEVVSPYVADMDRVSEMNPHIIKGLFDNGFMAVETPTEYGGSGSSFMGAVLIIEELAKVCGSVSLVVDLQNTLLTRMISELGTKEQKDMYLPRLCTDTLGSFCLSEAGSGSDAFALKTRADRINDEWEINGEKMWISNGQDAGVFIVMANTDLRKGYKGITCFIVDRDTPGLSMGKKEDKLGMRAVSTCTVHFEKCRIPISAVLGEVGKGYKYAIEGLNTGRIGIAAQMLGIATGAFNSTMPYLRQRKQFGQELSSFQALQMQYARVAMEIESARLLVYNAVRLKDQGKKYVKEAAMAKLYASEVAEKTTSQCINWLGGVGFTRDFPVEKFYRDQKVGQIYEGTSNMQLKAIADEIIRDYPI